MPGSSPQKHDYGYSGANAYNPQPGGTSNVSKIAIAAVGGAVVGTGAYYMDIGYSHRSRCEYGSYMGSCKSCYERYSREQCQQQPPQVPAARDDLMIFGFVPADYKSPITVTLSDLLGKDYPSIQPSPICPPKNWDGSESTWSYASGATEIYMTLTTVDELADTVDEVDPDIATNAAERAQNAAETARVTTIVFIALGGVIVMTLVVSFVLWWLRIIPCCGERAPIAPSQPDV